ncbi:hypothetical protein AB0F17_62685 [Nonomuraea sp. NPDC026600]|uniref:hypothetical protein n=1 Tax=Nonomuraea sp. NPDC026600 TaxID=3155363 RepID=UPI0033F62618
MSQALGWAGAAALVIRAALAARLLLSAVTVRGGSMTPTLLHGDVLLVLRGDHPRSEDSKQWGLCPTDRMYGVMLLRLRTGGEHAAA